MENFCVKSIQFSNENDNLDSLLIHSIDPKISNTNKQQSTWSQSGSISWRQMKESQRIITEMGSKETRELSPLNLYKIFQQKSNTTASSQSYLNEASKSSNHLPTSLPDLSFLSLYSKELPRSRTTSPLLQTASSSTNIARTTPSPTLIHQHKQDSDRPRTLKSIKRYKNKKHSTEPLGIFSQTSTVISKSSSSPKNFSREHHSETDLTQTNPSVNHLSLSTKRYRQMRRCQTDIILVDPIVHSHSLTDSPPNEFCLQRDDELQLNLDDPVPISHQSFNEMNSSILNHLLETITDVIKRLFQIKTFFLNNESNLQLDSLLKNDLCSAIQNILEHGRKDLKKIPSVYFDAKQIAQKASSYWLYKFQAFIFALLNQNELINWLYYFTRQKDFIQHYYQSPDALILLSNSSTFNLFERIMTQLEKLTSVKFHLTYHPPTNDEQALPSIIPISPRDWVMTLSRKTNSNDTFRSTLTRKFHAIFTKTNPSTVEQHPSIATFQSKISRPSLNVDKPKSVRYRPAVLPSN